MAIGAIEKPAAHQKVSQRKHWSDVATAKKLISANKNARQPPQLKVQEGKDGALVTLTRPPSESKEFAKTLLGSRPIQAILVQDIGLVTGVANTTYTTIISPDLISCASMTNWISLFDEVRVNYVELLCMPSFTTALASSVIPVIPWSIAFDPDTTVAAASTAENLESTHHIGPLQSGNPTGITSGLNQYFSTLQQTTEVGHLKLSSGRLMRSALPGNSGGVQAINPVQGNWVPTTTTSAIPGYFKPYVPALGANVVFGAYLWARFHCEFRMRG